MLSVMALWLGVYVLGLRLINRLESGTFAYNSAFTLLTQLIVQVTLNIAVVTAMVPPKGIPHPLLSYGGSNLVVSLISLGIVLSLTRAGASAPVPAAQAPVFRWTA
jgi:cell division protein FtsW